MHKAVRSIVSVGLPHWARKMEQLGHRVKLMSAQFVKPYRKNDKNDANDAEAICETVSIPSMRFVPIKSQAQHEVQALHRGRERLLIVSADPLVQEAQASSRPQQGGRRAGQQEGRAEPFP